jgi:hypothetical protein
VTGDEVDVFLDLFLRHCTSCFASDENCRCAELCRATYSWLDAGDMVRVECTDINW